MRLDLKNPEQQAFLFSLERLSEIHLVIDDRSEGVAARGTITVSDFRLERDPAGAVVSSEAR